MSSALFGLREGATRLEHVEQAAAAAEIQLDDDVVQAIDRVAPA
jgi:aryl-alcohol dehydrogenase-like predicted oxidoreductase